MCVIFISPILKSALRKNIGHDMPPLCHHSNDSLTIIMILCINFAKKNTLSKEQKRGDYLCDKIFHIPIYSLV